MQINLQELFSLCDSKVANNQRHQAFVELNRLMAQLNKIPVEQRDSNHPRTLLAVRNKINEINPLWWKPLGDKQLQLRRTQSTDAAFFSAAYSDADWARRYNRQVPWKGDLPTALQRAAVQSPCISKSLIWVIESAGETPVGTASLSNLDFKNRKVELSLGFVDQYHPVHVGKSIFWILNFCFGMLALNRVYMMVYRDNANVLSQLTRLGFQHEGTLIDHYYLPPGEYVDVCVYGTTRHQIMNNPAAQRLAKRLIGRKF